MTTLRAKLFTTLIAIMVISTTFQFLSVKTEAVEVGPLDHVLITNPTEGGSLEVPFTLTAYAQDEVDNNVWAECSFQVDGGGYDFMANTDSTGPHTQDITSLSLGEHTIDVYCTDSVDFGFLPRFIPTAYAASSIGTVTFTVVESTGSGSTGSGSSGGGSAYHAVCQNNMCVYVAGIGANECNIHADCVGSTNQNQNNTVGGENQNNNGGGSANMNSSDNTGSGGENNNGSGIPGAGGIEGGAVCGFSEQNIIVQRAQETPNKFITRGELLELLLDCYTIRAQDKPFPDVSTDHPDADVIDQAKGENIVDGYPDGLYRPDQFVNRAEGVKIIMLLVFGQQEVQGGKMDFKDTISGEWYERFVGFAQSRGYIRGYVDRFGNPTGYFGPADYMTYGQAVSIYKKALGI